MGPPEAAGNPGPRSPGAGGLLRHGVEVVHYTSLVAEAMGLPPRDEAYKRLQRAKDPKAAFDELAPKAHKRGVGEARLRKTLSTHFGG